jgi:hypothetical protein
MGRSIRRSAPAIRSIPFLKVRDNPFILESSKKILSVVGSIDPALCRLIKTHLARSVREGSRSCQSRWMNRRMAKRVCTGYRLNRADWRACASCGRAGLFVAAQMVALTNNHLAESVN